MKKGSNRRLTTPQRWRVSIAEPRLPLNLYPKPESALPRRSDTLAQAAFAKPPRAVRSKCAPMASGKKRN